MVICLKMKKWILLLAFISCAAVAQEDDGTEPFDSGVDDWGFEEGTPQPPKGDLPPSTQQPPTNPNDGSGASRFESPVGGGGSGRSLKAGEVRFQVTGEKRPPRQKKNWLEIKKSLMK